MNYLIYLCIFLMAICAGRCQEVDNNETLPDGGGGTGYVDYNQNLPYCYRFTWLGPEYDNTSIGINSTCSEYLDEKNCVKGCGVPCRTPFVITEDSTKPDHEYLWNVSGYRNAIICQQRKGQSCVKYSYSFDSVVQNVTYMCTKVQDIESGAIKDGCYNYDIDGYSVELCVCQSMAGHMPCNSSNYGKHLQCLWIVVLTALFYFRTEYL